MPHNQPPINPTVKYPSGVLEAMLTKGRGGRTRIIESPVFMGDSFRAWELALESLSPRSGELYRAGLALLFTRMSTTTERYYEDYKAALDGKDSRKINILINTVKSEITKLSKEYSSSHTLQSFKAYLSFMRANFRDVIEFDSAALNNWRKAQLPDKSKHISSIDKKGILNYIEKAKMYGRTEISTLRDVALIHCLKDSGLSRVDVVRMDVGDVLPAVEGGLEYVMLEDARQKTGVEMYPVLGPESLRALKVYLDARKRDRRRYIHVDGREDRSWVEVPGEVLRADSPLWIFTQKIEGFDYGDRFQADTVTSTFSKLNKNMDAGEEHFSPHSMRKYNWLMLEYSRIPQNWMCFLQGRSITDSSGPYSLDFDNHPLDAKKALLEAYRGAYENISVEAEGEKRIKALEESKTERDVEVAEQKQIIAQLTRRVDTLTDYLTITLEGEDKADDRLLLAYINTMSVEKRKQYLARLKLPDLMPEDSPLVDIKKSPKRGEST